MIDVVSGHVFDDGRLVTYRNGKDDGVISLPPCGILDALLQAVIHETGKTPLGSLNRGLRARLAADLIAKTVEHKVKCGLY